MLTKKHPNGSELVIQGQKIYLPPPGVVWDYLEGQGWIDVPIEDWGKKRSGEQYWRRRPVPMWYIKKRQDERQRQLKDPDYVDQECEYYRMDQWRMRMNGFWFHNGPYGPTYMTGLNWFYNSWWYIAADFNDGYPSYYDTDKEIFYLLRFACDDKNTLGLDLVTKRQSGKSAKSGAFLYEVISRTPSAHGGIQSKTEEDAKAQVYVKSLYTPFRRLPHFFIPRWRKPKRDTDTPSTLIFNNDNESQDEFYDETYIPEGLDSFIDYRSSKANAYDGPTLTAIVSDEVRKTPHVDVDERRRVQNKACTNMDGYFRGKIFETTTVDIMEGNTEEMNRYVKMWKESDANDRDKETGRTTSGMIHYLLHSDRARNYDRYGHTDWKRNRKIILMHRPDPAKSLKDYYSEVRKEPLNEGEAFSVVSKDCIFNTLKLNDQLEKLTWREDIKIERGRLRWVDNKPAGIDIRTKEKNQTGKVEWVSDPGGDFYLFRPALLKEELLNNIRWKAGIPTPENDKFVSVGIDTVDHDSVQEGYKSKMAAWALRRRDINEPDHENTFFLLYWGRPPKIDIAYENVLKMLYFLGVSGLYENNRDKMRMYFEFRGFRSLLWNAPGKKDPGLAASTRTKQDLAEVGIEYVEDYSDRINYADLLQDMLRFDLTNTRKSDLTMAALWTLLKDLYMLYVRKYADDAPDRNKRYFRRYKQRAGRP